VLSRTAVLVAVAATAGCSGFGPQTQAIYDPADGVTVRSGNVYVLNALFVANSDSTATLSVSLLDRFGDGDELTNVTVTTSEGEPIETTQHVQPFVLCADQLAILGQGAPVTISGDNFIAGDTVELVLTFNDAAPVRTQVPVLARDAGGTYDSVAESPAAAAAQPQSCASASLTPSPSPSPTS
jgi:hypothetical protein